MAFLLHGDGSRTLTQKLSGHLHARASPQLSSLLAELLSWERVLLSETL